MNDTDCGYWVEFCGFKKNYIFESNITTHYVSTTYNITYTPDYYELLRQDSCKIFYEC